MATLEYRQRAAAKPLEALVFSAANGYEPAYEGLIRTQVVRGMLEERRKNHGAGIGALISASMARLNEQEGRERRWGYTRRHSLEVGCFSFVMASEARKSKVEGANANPDVSFAGGVVHDIGKTFLPMALVVKEHGVDFYLFRLFSGRHLNEIERRVLRDEHLSAGTRYVRLFEGNGDLRAILDIVGLHHVMYNGMDSMVPSYPARLKGSELPLHSRIAKAADFISAVLPRHYRQEEWVLSLRRAVAYAIAVAGTEIDPFAISCFLSSTYGAPEKDAGGLIKRLRHPLGLEGTSDRKEMRRYVCETLEKDSDFIGMTTRLDLGKIARNEREIRACASRYGVPEVGDAAVQALRINIGAQTTQHDAN